ncbi:reverse transcriptase domain-containing protein [Tanacetum coccineum]
MYIELTNKSTQYPRGIAENVIIKIDKFIFPLDFVVLDMKEDHKIPIILGRLFLATAHAMIDVFNKKISFEVGNETITFDIKKSMKFSTPEDDECLFVDLIDNVVSDLVKEILPSSTLDSFLFEPILNFQQNIIISSLLNSQEKESLLKVLMQNKAALAWKVVDIKGFSPSFCTHKILMEDNFKPVVQPQRRLNPKVQDVVKAEIVKLLDSGLIYAISNSPWDFMEVFMDDFSVFGNSFDSCLTNLSKMLASKQDAKPRLIRWVLLLQEFTIEIKDKKGTENLAADHLSRLENLNLETLNEEAIRDSFPDKFLMAVQVRETAEDPWYADYANFLVSKIIPYGLTYHLRKKFLSDVKHYIWDDPYLFKSCPNGIIRRCVFGKEMHEILEHCHTGPTGGHYGANITARKIFESGFYWPTIFRDAAWYICDCDACQRAGNISSRNQMPLTNIIVSEVFDIWGIDFMRRFPSSRNNKYILVAVDYVSKWVEAKSLPTKDAREWVDKLDDALWAFRTAYKSPIGSTSFRIVYGKACHLMMEIEHKAYWALKNVNLDLDTTGKHKLKLFPGKLKSRWYGPYTISKVFPYGTVEVCERLESNLKTRISLRRNGIRGLIDSFSYGNKVLYGRNHIGETRLFYRHFARSQLLQSSLREESNAQMSLLF